MLDAKNTQHPGFQRGHPPQYWLRRRRRMRNFAKLTGSGVGVDTGASGGVRVVWSGSHDGGRLQLSCDYRRQLHRNIILQNGDPSQPQ